MNPFERLWYTLRVWTGLADPVESRLTPPHGWLLPVPTVARRERAERDALRVARRAGAGR